MNTKMEEVEGKRAYSVQFYHGTQEYNYKIDAQAGTILWAGSDIGFDVLTDGKFINSQKAEKVAITRANVKDIEATFTLVELIKNADKVVYKVAFYTERATYDCSVDATSSEVLNFNKVAKEVKTDNN